MAQFNIAFDETMGAEGGYANNPKDRGGETYKGISRVHNPTWPGWKIIDDIKKNIGSTASVINLHAGKNTQLQGYVRALYKANYWHNIKLDLVNDQSIANALFDISVNMGSGIAPLFLQQALNLCNKNGQSYPDILEDGAVGPITLSTLNNKANQKVIFNTINLLKGEKYLKIMRANKSQEIFWAGWLKRVLLK